MSNVKHVGEKIEATVAAALWDMADANASARLDSAPPDSDGADTLAVGAGALVRAIFTGRPSFNMAEFYAKWEEGNIRNTSEPVMKLHSMAFVTPNHVPYYSISGYMWTGGLPTYVDYMIATGAVLETTTAGRTVPNYYFQPRDIAVGPDGKIAVVDAGAFHAAVIEIFRDLGRDVPPNPAGNGTNIMAYIVKGFGDETCKEPPCVETVLGPLSYTDTRFFYNVLFLRTFTTPSIAVDSQGRIIVPLPSSLRTGAGHVQVFHPNGTQAFKLGDGEAIHKLIHPANVAVDSNDRILVSDPENSHLKIFNPNGSLDLILHTPTLPHLSSNHFRGAVNIATGMDDAILTVRRGNADIVRVHEPNGDLRFRFDPYGSKTDIGRFDSATATAIDPLGRIIVATHYGKILSYEPTGRFIEEFSLLALSPFGGSVSGMAVDHDGRLLVADFSSSFIYAFELDTGMPSIHNVYYHRSQDGRHTGGRTVEIMVNFTEAVTVTGRPALELSLGQTGRPALYASGSGSPVLRFSYEVRPCDSANPLRYAGANALSLNGGEIIDGSGNAANLTLPAPGSNGSLSAYRALEIGPATGACADAGGAPAVDDEALLSHGLAWTGPGDAPAVSDRAAAAAALLAGGPGDAPAVSDRAAAAAALLAGGPADAPAVSDRAAAARVHRAAAAGTPVIDDGAYTARRYAAGAADAPAVDDEALLSHGHAWTGPGDAPAVSDRAAAAAALLAGGPADAPAVSDRAAAARVHRAAAAGTPVIDDGAYAARGYAAGADGAPAVSDQAAAAAHRIVGGTADAPAVSDRAPVAHGHKGVAGAEPPAPVAVFAPPRAGAPAGEPYVAGQVVAVAIEFSAPVTVLARGGGEPYIELRTGSAGALAPYESGNNTAELAFAYEVRGGDVTGRLSYAGAGALILNGSTIASLASGAPASSVLPEPGEPGSLSAGASASGGPPVRIAPDPARPVLDIGILDEAGRAGGPVSLAALAAAYEFNERQGRAPGALLVNASVHDAGATAESAAAALRAAHAAGAGPLLYIGPSTDRGLHAAMPYAEENGIVLVSAGSTAPSLAIAGDRTFRLLPNDALEAAALARLAHNAGAESLHVVLENATYGPAGMPGVPSPPGRFSHGFAEALAGSAIPPVSGTITLAGAGGAYGADAAAASIDASVGSGRAPAAVVYLGSPEGLAALAAGSAGYPALASAAWFASGMSAGSGLLAEDGGRAAAFALQAGLSAVRWSPPPTDVSREVDSLMAGVDQGARHRAYAAYDAMLVLGTAAAAVRGDLDPAAIADGLPAAAAAHYGALGDIALDPAGDMWVPARYDLWTVAAAGQPGQGPLPAAWSRQPGAVDEARACSISLERARIDYGPIESGQTSRPHLQTIANTGQLPFARVDLTATPWHVDSPGACAPGALPSLPVGLSEIRTEHGGAFVDLAAGGATLAEGLEAGGRALLWYRLSLAGYADLPQAEITQCATYAVRCG